MEHRLSQSHRPYRLIGYTALWIGVFWLAMPVSVLPQNMATREQIARMLALEKVNIANGPVSGEVVNRLPHMVRDVQLFIRYTWLWDNETKPGSADPGTSTYYTLAAEIPPGGRLPFTFRPSPPLPNVSGGRFETSVAIAGFTEVIPQSR